MKKISMLLALLLVATCCMLASCGGDEESSAATSSTAATSSAATSSAAVSSEAASSVEESSEAEASSEESVEASSEESSEEPGFVKNPDALSTEGENVASGKSYTTSLLYRQGGEDSDWGWDENANITYPDDGNELTDGVIAADDAAFDNGSNPEWMGFHAKAPDYTENNCNWFTVNLEAVYELSELSVYVGTSKLGGGIGVPASVEFLVSEDGENFTSIGVITPTDDPAVACTAVTLECDVTAQYVQVRLTSSGWSFVCECTAK